MFRPRVIPVLLLRNGGLVKTEGFGRPRYIGDPINAVRIFNEKEVDELIVLDIDATVKSSEPDYVMIRNLAAECRMPLCYGGGVRTGSGEYRESTFERRSRNRFRKFSGPLATRYSKVRPQRLNCGTVCALRVPAEICSI